MRRTLVKGNKGEIVRSCQYLLTHNRWHNFYPGPIDGIFGDQMAAAIKRAKYFLGYPRPLIKPIFGNTLYHYLLPRQRGGRILPLPYQARKKMRRPKPVDHRLLVCDYARWGVTHEGLIHYRQIRPMPMSPWSLPMYIDCSVFATLAYKAAHAQDPNGMNYNGSGNTSSLLAHGRPVGVSQLRPGDLVFYSNPEHVGVYMGNMHVIEHGTEGCPRWEPLDYRTVTHCRSYLL